jgi:hypothetical protein
MNLYSSHFPVLVAHLRVHPLNSPPRRRHHRRELHPHDQSDLRSQRRNAIEEPLKNHCHNCPLARISSPNSPTSIRYRPGERLPTLPQILHPREDRCTRYYGPFLLPLSMHCDVIVISTSHTWIYSRMRRRIGSPIVTTFLVLVYCIIIISLGTPG